MKPPIDFDLSDIFLIAFLRESSRMIGADASTEAIAKCAIEKTYSEIERAIACAEREGDSETAKEWRKLISDEHC